ncbi:MAG: hypothetical protein ABSG46_15935, partial [Candidatus Binataceae bacterium]
RTLWLHSTEVPQQIVTPATLKGTHRGLYSPGNAHPSSPINDAAKTDRTFIVPALAIFSFEPETDMIKTMGVYFDRWKVMSDLKIGFTPPP